MKYHKFFAWATVVCFVLTMCTGYNVIGGGRKKALAPAAEAEGEEE